MKVLSVLAMLFIPAICLADPPPNLDRLAAISGCLETLQSLADKGVVADDKVHNALLGEAGTILGKQVTSEELSKYVKDQRTYTAKTTGLVTFTNVLWTLAAIGFSIAMFWLFGVYFIDMFMWIPPTGWEILCYLGVGACYWSGNIWLMFPASIMFVGCLFLTRFLHFEKSPRRGGGKWDVLGNVEDETVTVNGWTFNFQMLVSVICTVVWGIAAYVYESHLLGFMTMMSLFSALGFSVIVIPGCVGMGYTKDDKIPRTMSTAFLMLGIYVAYIIGSNKYDMVPEMAKAFNIFGFGALFIGCFVYFISLLIVSSKYYIAMTDGRYWSTQMLTLISGVLALYIGGVYDISLLQKVGGTFFCLYLLEKYYEIPWKTVGWAWSLLGLSLGLYWLSGFIANHPDYFIFGL